MDIIRLDSHVLRFSASRECSVLSCTIVLTNVAAADVAFTLRASNELHYRARPSFGVIPQGQSLSVLFYRKPIRTPPSVGASRDSFTLCAAAAPDTVSAAMSADPSWHGTLKLELKVEFLSPTTRQSCASASRSHSQARPAQSSGGGDTSDDRTSGTGLLSSGRVLRFASASLDGSSVLCDTIRISNVSGKELAFAVRSTNSRRFRVIPSSGVIPRDQSRYVIFRLETKRAVPRTGRCEDMFLISLAQAPSTKGNAVPTSYWSGRKDIQMFGMLFYSEFVAIRSRQVSESVPVGPSRSPIARLWPVILPISSDRRSAPSDSLRVPDVTEDLDIVRLEKKVISLGPYPLKNKTLICDVLRISNASKSDVAFCIRPNDDSRINIRPDSGVIGMGQSQVLLFTLKPPWTIPAMGSSSRDSALLYVTEASGMATLGLPKNYWTSIRRNDIDVAKITIRVACSQDAPSTVFNFSADSDVSEELQQLLKRASREAKPLHGTRRRRRLRS